VRGGKCGRQLLIMGAPRSGASLASRLLALAGVWAGRPDQLAPAPAPGAAGGVGDPLSGWERADAHALNAALAANFTAARSFSPGGAGAAAGREAFRAAAGAVVADMEQYCGWPGLGGL
jgi:hypothetical protein